MNEERILRQLQSSNSNNYENDLIEKLLRTYTEYKRKHPNAVILCRVGSCYESIREDAQALSDVLNLTLIRREYGDEVIKMAGFHSRQLDTYLPKLIRAGLHVAISEPETLQCTEYIRPINHKPEIPNPMDYKNDVDLYLYFMWNYWTKEVCEQLWPDWYEPEYGNYMWKVWMTAVRDSGNDPTAAPARFWLATDSDKHQTILDFARNRTI